MRDFTRMKEKRHSRKKKQRGQRCQYTERAGHTREQEATIKDYSRKWRKHRGKQSQGAHPTYLCTNDTIWNKYHIFKYLRVINQANELLNKIFCLSSLKNTELIFIICGFWVFKFASSLKFICNPQISISALSWSFTYIELWTFKVAQSAYFQLRLNKATLCLLLKKTEI